MFVFIQFEILQNFMNSIINLFILFLICCEQKQKSVFLNQVILSYKHNPDAIAEARFYPTE